MHAVVPLVGRGGGCILIISETSAIGNRRGNRQYDPIEQSQESKCPSSLCQGSQRLVNFVAILIIVAHPIIRIGAIIICIGALVII